MPSRPFVFARTRRLALGLAATAALAAAIAPAANAGTVNILSTHREVGTFIQFHGGPETPDSKSSNAVGAFNTGASSATATSDDSFEGSADASIDSFVGQTGFRAAGTLKYTQRDDRALGASNANQASVHFTLRTDFEIDEPYNYVLSSSFEYPLGKESASSEDEDVHLFGGGGAHPPVVDGADFPGVVSFEGSGVLPPGKYTFEAFDAIERRTGQTNGDESFQVDYAAELKLSPVNGGNGGPDGPAAVPLPPAAWSGLATLALASLPYARRRLLAGGH
jgi:hypothetical protein